jgi:RNA polymerase sigma factor for flagellar operon FliA
MGTDVAAVDRAAQETARRVLSIDTTDSTIADLVRDDSPNPEEALLTAERLHWLRAAVHTLPERLRVVVEGVFLHDRSMAELAEELDVTQSRVSQLRTEALTLLRDGLNAHLEPELVTAAERPDGVAERRRQTYFAAVAARAAMAAAPSSAVGVVPAQRHATGATSSVSA